MNECPDCGAKILWGLADLERMEKVDVEPGDVVLAGCLLGEENRCPRCGALVLTAAYVMRRPQDEKGNTDSAGPAWKLIRTCHPTEAPSGGPPSR